MSSECCVQISPTPITLVTTAETAIITGPGVPENNPTGQGVRVSGYINVTPGAGTTGIQIRVHAGINFAGPVIGGPVPTHTVTAGAPVSIPFEAVDFVTVNPSFLQTGPGSQYTLSVQQVGATGNGTVNNATLGQTPCTASNG